MCCVSPRTICVEKLDFACAGFKSSCALSTTQRIQTDGDFLCLKGFSLRVGDAQQVTAASNGPRRPWENFHVASTPHVRVQWHAMQKGRNAAPNAVKQLESSIAHTHTHTCRAIARSHEHAAGAECISHHHWLFSVPRIKLPASFVSSSCPSPPILAMLLPQKCTCE